MTGNVCFKIMLVYNNNSLVFGGMMELCWIGLGNGLLPDNTKPLP